MWSAGIDIGSHSAKAAIFDGQAVRAVAGLVSEDDADTAARSVLGLALAELRLGQDAVERVVATGWGRRQDSFAQKASSELVCASRGVRWLVPAAGTVVDIGAEGCTAP